MFCLGSARAVARFPLRWTHDQQEAAWLCDAFSAVDMLCATVHVLHSLHRRQNPRLNWN